MKRIITIQDISCIGKCSLTVALPIISAMGVEASILPTAVLSTHTMFDDFTFMDLTNEITPISEHWKKENITFDAIYTGYLGSFEQLQLVSKFFDDYKTESNYIVVDPVMADNGKLYPGFDEAFAKEMANLCGKADIILPNLTEASFMTGLPYKTEYDLEYVKEVLNALADLGAKKVVLTGVCLEDGKLGVMCYDAATGEYFSYYNEKIDASYHGTGDIYASTFTGALMNDFTIEESLEIAVDYTVECIKDTLNDDKSRWYGVNFETSIPYLLKRLGKC